jgi:putative ABC transport system permease protein
VKAINTKLFRDMANMRGAVITIALVVAAGIAAFVTLRGTYLSMVRTRDNYYASDRFGDVFADLERAPNALAGKLEDLPGVERAYTRVVGSARVPLEELEEPAQAQILSLPTHGQPPLNGVRLVAGRMPSNDRDDEVLLGEMFAETHKVKPGRVLKAIIEGRERKLRIVGLAMSPEFVLSVPANGQAPAPERFAVLWMPRPAVEAAYDMRGAFNNVVLGLSPEAKTDATLDALDRVLDPYGGRGSYGRDRQISNYFLAQDLTSLALMATVAPLIFLAVAAFLLNVVLTRLVELDRPQIATLKAVGYSNREVGLHYFQLTMVIALGGGTAGLLVGRWLGGHMTALYTVFYRMPSLSYRLSLDLATSAIFASLAAGIVGSAIAVRRVAALPPAEAMRPAAPPSYKRGAFIATLGGLFSASARMVARELLRRPSRTIMSALGIAAATGIVVLGQFFTDAVGFLVDYYMQQAQRETIAVSFMTPVPEASVRALASVPGVEDVQWQTMMPVRVRAGHRERTVSLVGHATRHSMRPLLDEEGDEVGLGPDDVLLTGTLAQVLGIEAGDKVTVEPMDGERSPRTITMTGKLDELMGLWIHMPSEKVHALLGNEPLAMGATLMVQRDFVKQAQQEITDMPQVASALRKDLAIAEFRKQTGSMTTFSAILTLFAIVIAVSVVYNNARIALSMRARELASLRVLGFTRGEISSILLGELAVQVIIGVPLGLWFGREMVFGMLLASDQEAFRFPMNVSHHTYAVAALVTTLAAVGVAFLVRRQLNKLDLIEVLKTRE